jgi:protein-S-isoprenylcysteine O-methyltransferase Ste14
MRLPELKIPPVAVVLLLGTAMWAAARFAPALRFDLPAARIVAAGLAAVGTIVAALGVASFRRARTTVNPLRPDAAASLVITGIYRRTRNPMYLGMLLVLLGWGLSLHSIPALVISAAFVPLMNRLQIIPEERALAARFGHAFTDYQAKVRRWL